MESGKKKIRVIIKESSPEISLGKVENVDSSILIKDSGIYFFERVGDRTFRSNKRSEGLRKEEIAKIRLNIDTYCSQKNKTKNEIYSSGEIHLKNSTINTKKFPIEEVSIITGNDLEEITKLCTIDYVNGMIQIPDSVTAKTVSVIYSVKKIKIHGAKKLKIPSKLSNTVEVIKI